MKLVLAYKDYSGEPGVYHAGLGVTGLNLAKCLGAIAELWPVFDGFVLRDRLRKDRDVTHVAMLAPWVDTPFLRKLTAEFPAIQFTITCHSNVGFLQVDPYSTRLLREQIELEADRRNFRVSANSEKLCRFVRAGYSAPCLYLPNLYPVDGMRPCRPRYSGGVLRIGIFGATRILKNIGTAVAASIIMSNQLQVDTEIWLSGKREEGGRGVMEACKALLSGVPRVRIVMSDWQTWPQFRETAAHMNLMLQPSFTESFNNVTADGIAVGVPVAVSTAIDWVPRNWQANPDDPEALANIGLRMIHARNAARPGQKALSNYTARGLAQWNRFLAS